LARRPPWATGEFSVNRLSLPNAAALSLSIFAFLPRSESAERTWDLTVPKEVHVSTLLAPFKMKPRQSETIAFDIDPDGIPAVAEAGSLRMVGSSERLMNLDVRSIDDFAWMRDGNLLLATQGYLAALTPKGIMQSLLLPNPGMRIRPAGENSAYVFGGTGEPTNHNVFLFARDGTVTKLITLPLPVKAVAGDGIMTYLAVGQTLIRFSWNQPVTAIFEADAPLISLEIAPRAGLFFSTTSTVGYVMGNGLVYEFLHGLGGMLRIRGSALYVLSSDGSTLLRFSPLEGFEALVAR
jgi:hypothetical protein